MLKKYIGAVCYKVADIGTFICNKKVNYRDFAIAVSRKVISGECERGITLDASSIVSYMLWHKVLGVRSALCQRPRTISISRKRNNANILTMGKVQHKPEDILHHYCIVAQNQVLSWLVMAVDQ